VSEQQFDFSRIKRRLIERRRGGYMAGGALAIGFAVFAVAQFAPAGSASTPSIPAAVADSASVDTLAPSAADTLPANPADATVAADSTIAIDDAAIRPAGDPFAFATITDGVPRVARPDTVRGIYLNAWAAGSSRKRAKLIAIADSTEINAFVIDVKEGGEISYRSQVPLARHISADRDYIRDVRGMLRQLREHGIYPIARIVVFKDEVLARARPEWAVQRDDGSLWVDGAEVPWVDSFNRDVWDYNVAIAREALELGFSEVQWDYVRFPDVPRALMATATWPARAGRLKEDAIREFLLYTRDTLKPYAAPVTADVFGLTVSTGDDMGIGQKWDKLIDATDVLLPMVYPSHFARGTYGIGHPNASPHETVLQAMQHAVQRSAGVANAAGIRPWLQDFTLGPPRYDATQVRAQIDAVYAAGLSEWVLWNPSSNYTVEALLRR
jgi:hypothetical protein